MSTKTLKIKKIRIVGVIPSFAFQRAKHWALELHRNVPQRYPTPEISGMLELDWNEKLLEWRRKYGKDYWCLRRPVAVFINDEFVGNDVDLMKLTSFGNVMYQNIPRRNLSGMQKIIKEEYHAFLKKTKRTYCYLDICVDNVFIGTITFELYSDILPKTCENFKSLCIGTKGDLFSYKGSRIHRIVKAGWLQGGDIQYVSGGGGYSAFGKTFEDECYGISHNRFGVLSMANKGKHKNGSQFVITLGPCIWMDRYYVAFGQVVEGLKVLRTLEKLKTWYECPLQKVEIKNCGKYDLGDPEDVDARYTESKITKRKRPVEIENLTEHLMKILTESLTEALERKQHIRDVLDERDVPSKMNLQMYFQGLYSVPDEVLEDSAQYIRKLRRQLYRDLKPMAMEVVEAIMYDLLVTVLAKITNLDDIKETLGAPLYKKLIEGIDMEIEMMEKEYVQNFISQLILTAEQIVTLVCKSLEKVRQRPKDQVHFEKGVTKWVKEFILQESYADDTYHIMEHPSFSKNSKEWKKPCPVYMLARATPENLFDPAVIKKRMKEEEQKPPIDPCAETQKEIEPPLTTQDIFSKCRYDFLDDKGIGNRIPILDFVDTCRYKLRLMRHQENRKKPTEHRCFEKQLNGWMREVIYIPETLWIKETIFDKDAKHENHIEEIMYGAMTVGLLEMYFLLEQHIKAKTRAMVRKRKSRPHDVPLLIKSDETEKHDLYDGYPTSEEREPSSERLLEAPAQPDESPTQPDEPPSEPLQSDSEQPTNVTDESELGRGDMDASGDVTKTEEFIPDAGEEGFRTELIVLPEYTLGPEDEIPDSDVMEDIDIEALLAEITALKPEEVNIASFKWLKSYILEKGNDAKSNFTSQVHKWLQGETFCFTGLLSKHSLASRASLLSLSFSLASLIQENNTLKTEIKNFVYDLWELYFNEMFKEATYQYPPPFKPASKEDGKGKISKRYSGMAGEGELEDLGEDIIFGEEGHGVLESAKSSDTSEEGEYSQESAHYLKIPKDKGKGKTTTKEEDLVDEEYEYYYSSEEERPKNIYQYPFWVRFLTEVTKQALGKIAKLSRLPRRLFLTTDSEIAFDDKMKDWFEYNTFNPPKTKGKEILDYISLHHTSLENLDSTARSYLKKRRYVKLIDKCTRKESAKQLANDLLMEVLGGVADLIDYPPSTGVSENIVSDLMGAVILTESETKIKTETFDP